MVTVIVFESTVGGIRKARGMTSLVRVYDLSITIPPAHAAGQRFGVQWYTCDPLTTRKDSQLSYFIIRPFSGESFSQFRYRFKT